MRPAIRPVMVQRTTFHFQSLSMLVRRSKFRPGFLSFCDPSFLLTRSLLFLHLVPVKGILKVKNTNLDSWVKKAATGSAVSTQSHIAAVAAATVPPNKLAVFVSQTAESAPYYACANAAHALIKN